MWIRSQDKKRLVDVKNVIITEWNSDLKLLNEYVYQVDDKEQYFIKSISDSYEFILGEYSTKEKALIVLNLIQKYIGGMQDKKIIKEANDYYSITSKYNIPLNYCKNGIFQMPEDNKI